MRGRLCLAWAEPTELFLPAARVHQDLFRRGPWPWSAGVIDLNGLSLKIDMLQTAEERLRRQECQINLQTFRA